MMRFKKFKISKKLDKPAIVSYIEILRRERV